MPLPSSKPSHWKIRAGVLLSAFEIPNPTFRNWLDRDGLELTGDYRIVDALRLRLLRDLTESFQIRVARAVVVVREADEALRSAAAMLDEDNPFLSDDWPVIHVPPLGCLIEWFPSEGDQTLASLRAPKLVIPLKGVTRRSFLAVLRVLDRSTERPSND